MGLAGIYVSNCALRVGGLGEGTEDGDDDDEEGRDGVGACHCWFRICLLAEGGFLGFVSWWVER